MTSLDNKIIAVFGGCHSGELSDGFLLNLETNTVQRVLGAETDLKFGCWAPMQQIGKARHVTVCRGADLNVHMLQLSACHNGSSLRTRSIKNFGHYYESSNDE